MSGVRGILLYNCKKKLHTSTLWRGDVGPSESLKKRVAEMEKKRKRKDPRKNQLFVEVPESRSFLDTATMPMILTVAGTALFAKLLMMLDESNSQEMIERKIKNSPPGQGSVRMLSREEWEEIKEVRPRTPFESKLARPNARIRTGEPLHWVWKVFETYAATPAHEWKMSRTGQLMCSQMVSLGLKNVLDVDLISFT